MFHTLRNRLRLQLVVLISLLALASAGAYALLTGGLARTQIVQEQFKLQRHLASRMASQLAHDMAARSQEMRFLSSLERMRDPSRAMADKQALLMAKKAAYPIYAWIGLTDTSGRIVASTEPRLNGADVSQRAWFKGGRNDLHFVDIHDAVLLGKLLPRPQHDELPLRLIDVALPVRNPQGEFMGVLAAHLSLDWTYELRDHLLDELEQEPLEMVLINHVGEVIVGSPSLPAQQVDLSRLSTVQHALAGQVSTAVEAWSDGRRYLSTAVPTMGNAAFPGLGWVVIVRTDEDTALAGARRLTQFTLLAGLAAALGFSGLMWRVVSRKLRPLERLSGSARELATSDLATPLPEPQGDGEVAVFTRSLTQLVNALRDSRTRFQSLFEHAPVALIFANRDGDLLNHNTRFERLFGAGTERITHVDQWFESAFPDGAPRDEARRRWAHVRAMISDQPVEMPGAEYEIQRTDGTSRIVATSAIAMPDGVLVAFHDLTERRLAEREVQHLNAELERRVIERTAELSAANRELDSFAYTVSHDLRAPLRSVNGFAQLLATECADRLDTHGMDYLERMQASTRKMGELIEGLLALSRHTQKPLERQPVNLSAIATRRLAELAGAEPDRSVVTDVEPGLIADCDPSLAEALLTNLLDNAWKYSGKAAQAHIRFCRGEVAGLQGFCVCDNGAGFDMAKAQRLFEPFQRLHAAADFSGTGVGLATVHRIVDRHGGRIVADAAPGAGARFCFTLRPDD